MRIVAILQQKGGVGKTTISANLAGELLRRERTVRLFDLDPQRSLADLAETAGRHGGVLAERVERYDIRDATDSLAFSEAVRRVEVDYVLLDCPPGFHPAALAAALIADLALLPVQPAVYDLRAARKSRELLLTARQQRGGGAPRIALVPSRVSQATGTGREWAALLGSALDEPVLPTIGQHIALADCQSKGLTVREYTRRDRQAVEEFSQLAVAVEQLLGDTNGYRA